MIAAKSLVWVPKKKKITNAIVLKKEKESWHFYTLVDIEYHSYAQVFHVFKLQQASLCKVCPINSVWAYSLLN